MASEIKVVIAYQTNGADQVKKVNKDLTDSVENFTKKLKNADFTPYDSLAKKLQRAEFALPALTGSERLTSGLKSVEQQGAQTAKTFALNRQEALALTYTFNDVTASLASGASPFTILLQQGGQVTQAFGGIGTTVAKLIPIFVRWLPAITAIGAAVAAVKFLRMGQDAADAALELKKLSDQAGVSLETIQRFKTLGDQRGLGIEGIASGFERLRKAALESANETQKLQRQIEASRNLVTGRIEDPALAKKEQDLYNGSLSDTNDILTKLLGSLSGFDGGVGETEALIRRAAVAIRSLPKGLEGALSLEKLKEAFGPELVKILGDTTISLDKLYGRIKGETPQVSKEIVALAEKNKAINKQIEQASANASQSIGNIFLPATLLKNNFILQYLTDTKGGLESFKQSLVPIAKGIEDFFKILSGDDKAAKSSPLIADFVKALGLLGDAFTAIKSLATDAFKSIYDAIDLVAKQLGGLIGIDLNGWALIGIAAVANLAGAFKLLSVNVLKNIALFAGVALVFDGIATAFYTVFQDIDQRGAYYGARFEKYFTIPAQKAVAYLQKLFAKVTFDSKAESFADSFIAGLDQRSADIEKKLPDLEKKGNEEGKGFWARFWDNLEGQADFADQKFSEIFGKIGEKFTSAFSKDQGQSPIVQNTKKAADQAKQSIDALAQSQQKLADGQTVSIYRGTTQNLVDVSKAADGATQSINNLGQATTTVNIRRKDAPAAAYEVLKTKVDEAGKAIDDLQSKGKEPLFTVQETGSAQQSLIAAEDGVNRVGAALQKQRTEAEKSAQVDPSAKTAEGAKAATTALDQQNISLERNKQLKTDIAAQPITQPQPQAASIVPQAGAEIEKITGLVNAAAQAIAGLGNTALTTVGQTITDVGSTAEQAINSLIDTVNRAIGRVNELANAVNNVTQTPFGPIGGGSQVITAATGGYIRGAGTGTSDSILARVSNGEYVVNAAAVQKWGVSFFHALNGLRAPALSVGFPKFASGGLVGPISAAPMSPGHSVTLVIGGQSYGPLRADDAVFRALERKANSAQWASAYKRQPSRKG